MINFKLYLIDNDAPEDLIEWVGDRTMKRAYYDCLDIEHLAYMYELAVPIHPTIFRKMKRAIINHLEENHTKLKLTYSAMYGHTGYMLLQHYRSDEIVVDHFTMWALLNCYTKQGHDTVKKIMCDYHRRYFPYMFMEESLLA